LVRNFLAWSIAFGFHFGETVRAFRGLVPFVRDWMRFREQNKKAGSPWRIEMNVPCLTSRFEPGGTASGHYFHQDLLVARRIFARNPVRHVDIGSRVDGFVAHVATFRQIEVFDLRPVPAPVPNIIFRQCDLMKLPVEFEQSCDSLSCLHVMEHFGLGRYGDPIDLYGYEAGFESLRRLLKPNGILYLSVPMGRERIEFNGHRIFSLVSLLELFGPAFELESFSYVDDSGALHENIPVPPEMLIDSRGLDYGCGIFELRKLM
jgi:SAM-dependent methyltransferase